jgi:hypothetical protein
MKFSQNDAQYAANRLNYKGDIKKLQYAMNTENEEHRDVTHDSPTTSARIAIAHMKEFPKIDYYAALDKMEKRWRGIEKFKNKR